MAAPIPPPSALSPLLAALAVGTGGFVGAVARWAASSLVQRLTPAQAFPAATFVVNIVGCFALGALATHLVHRDPPSREVILLFAGTGLLGAFTTFSTFSVETLFLLRDRHFVVAAAYVGGSVLIGLAAAFAGRALVLR